MVFSMEQMFVRSRIQVNKKIIKAYNKVMASEKCDSFDKYLHKKMILMLSGVKQNYLIEEIIKKDLDILKNYFEPFGIIIKPTTYFKSKFTILGTKLSEVEELHYLNSNYVDFSDKKAENATRRIGELLGFPACCIYKPEDLDSYINKYNGMCDPSGYYYSINNPWPFYANSYGKRFCHHVPCSPKCKSTKKLCTKIIQAQQLIDDSFTIKKLLKLINENVGFVLQFQSYLFIYFKGIKRGNFVKVLQIHRKKITPNLQVDMESEDYSDRIKFLNQISKGDKITVSEEKIIIFKKNSKKEYLKKDKTDGNLIIFK